MSQGWALRLKCRKAFQMLNISAMICLPSLILKSILFLRFPELKVSDMHEVYVKPQESGMRYNTYWAELTDADENLQDFVLKVRTPLCLMQITSMSVNGQKAAHEDLKEYETTAVHIDGYMLGAGSNACGPAPFDEHKKTIVSEYENSFTVKPIGNRNV